MQTQIVVVGAGLTGLTTAYYLRKAGVDCIVVEKNDQAGGVIKTISRDGFTFEQGPNTGVISNETVVSLFDELNNCSIATATSAAKKRYILKNGQWQALPSGLGSAISTPLFTLGDKFRILGEPFRKPGTNPHESLAEFVCRRLGQSFLDYAVDPFVKGVYSGNPNQLIVKYALPKLYNLEQKYGSLIGGSIKKQFEKKTELQKRVNRKTFSAQGGLSSLVKALYEKVGSEHFQFNCEKTIIEPYHGGFKVSYIQNGELQIIESKQVITTVGAYALDEMLPFVDKVDIDQIASLQYAPVAEVSLGFESWNGFNPDGFGGLIPTKENRDILGVLFMSTLFENRSPKGGQLFTVFVGGSSKPHLLSLPDDDLKQLVLKEFCDIMNCKDCNPSLIQIVRHTKAIPQYGIDSGIRFDTVESIEKQYKGLQIGGNLRDGIGMADRIKQGHEMATKAISHIK